MIDYIYPIEKKVKWWDRIYLKFVETKNLSPWKCGCISGTRSGLSNEYIIHVKKCSKHKIEELPKEAIEKRLDQIKGLFK